MTHPTLGQGTRSRRTNLRGKIRPAAFGFGTRGGILTLTCDISTSENESVRREKT